MILEKIMQVVDAADRSMTKNLYINWRSKNE